VVVTGPLTVPGLLDELAARQEVAEAEINDLREQMTELSDVGRGRARTRPVGWCTRERAGRGRRGATGPRRVHARSGHARVPADY
jgi:hypothetical protein